jgi:hypothetical protein
VGRLARCRRLLVAAIPASLLVTGLGSGAKAAPQGSPQPLNVTVSDATGTTSAGRIMAPGRPCTDGGSGAYRHYSITSPLSPGVFGQIPGTIDGSIDVHHDGTEPPTGAVSGGAFLLGDQTHATLSNYRGALQVLLHGGRCGSTTAPISFDPTGHVVSAGPFTGSFDVNTTPGTTNGAYRGATGHGTYTLNAGVAPGANNKWSLVLNGNISILEPTLTATVVSSFWGDLGIDYAFRIVTVTYNVTNNGPGDAYNTALASTSSPTNDVTALGPQPQALGDLLAGQSQIVTVRYRLGLLSPCTLVILNCSFTSVVTMSGADALDVPGTFVSTLPVTAPTLPPPLS